MISWIPGIVRAIYLITSKLQKEEEEKRWAKSRNSISRLLFQRCDLIMEHLFHNTAALGDIKFKRYQWGGENWKHKYKLFSN
jgi:hypothetical protein